MTLEYVADGIAACVRAQVKLRIQGEPEDSLLSRKVRRAQRALEDAGEIIKVKQEIQHLRPGRQHV